MHAYARRSTTCSATASYSAAPIGRLVLHVAGDAPPRRTSPTPTWSATRCRCSSTARTSVRTPEPDGCTCRRRTLGAESHDGDLTLDGHLARRCATVIRIQVDRALGDAGAGRPLVAPAAWLGAGRGRRLRRRRARHCRRVARREFEVLARPVVPSRPRTASARRCAPGDRRRHDAATSQRPTARASGSPASRPATSRGASGCCPAPNAAPCRPCTRWPGASTTSATARLPAEQKLAALAKAPRRAATAPDDPDDPVQVALAHAAPILPIPLDAFGELVDGCEMDVTRPYLRRPDRPRRLLPLRRRVDRPAVARRVRPALCAARRRDAEPARQHARRRAAADQHPARHPRGSRSWAGSICPNATSDLFGVELQTRPDGSLDPQDGRLAELIRFEAARAAGPLRRGLAAAAGARPAQRRLLRRDGRHLPRAARSHRRRPVDRHARTRVAADSRQAARGDQSAGRR